MEAPQYGDRVVIVGDWVGNSREEDEALVLDTEGEYIWLFSKKTRNIYRHNPECIMEHKARKVLFDTDFCKPIDSVFDEHGVLSSDVFWHATPQRRVHLERLLKMFRLMTM